MNTQIKKATTADCSVVIRLIAALLADFNTAGSTFNIDIQALEHVTRQLLNRTDSVAYIYYAGDKPVGLVVVTQAFAIYNGGLFGVITELYVDPNHRSMGIGKQLLDQVYLFAKEMNWEKIEVGAPNKQDWPRSTAFYLKNNFIEKGPKLRIDL